MLGNSNQHFWFYKSSWRKEQIIALYIKDCLAVYDKLTPLVINLMEVLGLCSYPVEAAATRYRFTQFVNPLAEKGINLTVNPFLNSEEFASFYKSGKTFRKTLGMFNP